MKKTIALTVLLVMVFAFCSCSGGSGTGKKETVYGLNQTIETDLFTFTVKSVKKSNALIGISENDQMFTPETSYSSSVSCDSDCDWICYEVEFRYHGSREDAKLPSAFSPEVKCGADSYASEFYTGYYIENYDRWTTLAYKRPSALGGPSFDRLNLPFDYFPDATYTLHGAVSVAESAIADAGTPLYLCLTVSADKGVTVDISSVR